MEFDHAKLRAFAAAVTEGSLDAAARRLHVTPSAVSQRIKALETHTGQVLPVRSIPVRTTAAGDVVLRLARQVEHLTTDATSLLRDDDRDGTPLLPIAVNADSLGTWVLPALAPLASQVRFDIRREDEERTSLLLRDGTVVAAATAQAAAVPGCRSVALGAMRYRPRATTSFLRTWFPDGVTPDALVAAPTVLFDRDDDLQHGWLRARGAVGQPPCHYVPSTADHEQAIRLGLGWGMVPDFGSASPLGRREDGLVLLDPEAMVERTLHWQQWRLESPSLRLVGEAVVAAAHQHLQPVSDAAGHR